MSFHDNSKNKNRKNRKIVFSFVSAHCVSFMKVGSKLRGGVSISLVGTEPLYPSFDVTDVVLWCRTGQHKSSCRSGWCQWMSPMATIHYIGFFSQNSWIISIINPTHEAWDNTLRINHNISLYIMHIIQYTTWLFPN